VTIKELPEFTHFDMTLSDLPPEYYLAIGHALYRWSQLEGTIGALAVSIQAPKWLEAVQELRPRGTFNLTDLLRRIKNALTQCEGHEGALEHLERAESLFKSRKALFHSVWGRVSGPQRSAVGIQEWSAEDYSNFRVVPLDELVSFGADCASTAKGLLKTAIPLLHGSETLVVDDGDGLTKVESKTADRLQ
jgi:hypothetical protein